MVNICEYFSQLHSAGRIFLTFPHPSPRNETPNCRYSCHTYRIRMKGEWEQNESKWMQNERTCNELLRWLSQQKMETYAPPLIITNLTCTSRLDWMNCIINEVAMHLLFCWCFGRSSECSELYEEALLLLSSIWVTKRGTWWLTRLGTSGCDSWSAVESTPHDFHKTAVVSRAVSLHRDVWPAMWPIPCTPKNWTWTYVAPNLDYHDFDLLSWAFDCVQY